MKFFNIKLACIFIIAMFCFAPLNAVDLNQDDGNNKYINQDDNNTEHIDQDMDDTKIDVENNSSDIGSDSTEDVNPAELVDPDLSIKVDDITEGEQAVVCVSANSSLTDDVNVYLKETGDVYSVHVKDGIGQKVIYGLGVGNYNATVSFLGDDTFKSAKSSTTFKVSPDVELADLSLSIKVNDIVQGDKAVAEITANESLNGGVRISLNNSNTVYPVYLIDGSGSVIIDEDLDPGLYNATVKFGGDRTFKYTKNSTVFKVSQKPA